MPTLNELLAPQILFKQVVSRVKKVGDVLQRFWNIEMGSGNAEDIDGRVSSYDIFDNVRTVAGIRSPIAGPARTAANPVNQQPVTCARIYSSKELLYERIFPLRKMGGPSVEVDEGGADYIRRQQEILRMEMANTREWLTAGMMRGSCQVLVSGDDWIPVMSGGTYSLSWQIPAGNLTTLNIDGSGAVITNLWSDTINAGIFENIMSIDAQFWAVHGFPLKHIWINGDVWSMVTNNAGLKARSGSSNVVFESFTGMGQTNNTDTTQDEYKAVIRCLPGITWHIYNGGLVLNGTFTKFFPSTGQGSAVFCPEPSDLVVTAIRGSEYIQENEMSPAVKRTGPYFYPEYTRNPARIGLIGWDSYFPALKVPKALASGTIA